MNEGLTREEGLIRRGLFQVLNTVNLLLPKKDGST